MATRQIITIALDENAYAEYPDAVEVIHQIIAGSHTLDDVTIEAELTDLDEDEEGSSPALPLTSVQARGLMDGNGYLTVVTTVDQEAYLEARSYAATEGADTHHDLVHNKTFDFGVPYDSTTTILAVQGSDFVVSYTTQVREVLGVG